MGTTGKDKPKMIVILGPTASGKSKLAVDLAVWINKERLTNGGEIISADSRQVYRGMDLGSGKISKKEMKGIPHHLIDVASPKRKFSAGQYRKLAQRSIDKILKKGKVPILCGGTAFYINSVTKGMVFPEIASDQKLRERLEKKSAEELYQMLRKLDPRRARDIEKGNPRRLIRAIEIVLKTKRPVPKLKFDLKYNPLVLGIKKKDLEKRIEKRLSDRIKRGMIKEVKNLKESGVSWKRLEEFGLEYKWAARYLQGKISRKEMTEGLLADIIKFSKKQMAWWKKDKDINWVSGFEESKKIVRKFLKKEEQELFLKDRRAKSQNILRTRLI